MVKRIILSLALLTGLSISFSVNAQVSAYLGARTNYAGVGAARLGVGDWEFGMFSPGGFAINKKMKFAGNYYVALGLGVHVPVEAAIFAGAGFNYGNWVGFGIRGELYAIQGAAGYSGGAGTLGVSYNF